MELFFGFFQLREKLAPCSLAPKAFKDGRIPTTTHDLGCDSQKVFDILDWLRLGPSVTGATTSWEM